MFQLMRRGRRSFASTFALSVAALSALASPVLAAGKTITAVMHSDLRVLDPIFTSAYISRDHGYMVYDTLIATDANFKIQPQMADWKISDDKLTYTFTLRDGLKWHDGTPVTAEDCVASRCDIPQAAFRNETCVSAPVVGEGGWKRWPDQDANNAQSSNRRCSRGRRSRHRAPIAFRETRRRSRGGPCLHGILPPTASSWRSPRTTARNDGALPRAGRHRTGSKPSARSQPGSTKHAGRRKPFPMRAFSQLTMAGG